MIRPLAIALLALLVPLAAAAEPRWRIQFFHDEDGSKLYLQDLAFPAPRRGIACGALLQDGRRKPVVLLTTDGGGRWELVAVKELCRSVFFLNEGRGWMVTSSGVWRSEDSGRSWKRLRRLEGVLRVYFADANRGWAVGAPKAVWETSDGGEVWTPVKAAAEPRTKAENTAYTWIDFLGPKVGMIVGASRPPRRGEERGLPDWMEPERTGRRREWPAMSIFLETRDGGGTWRTSATSMFGQVTRLRLTPDLQGLALIEFQDSFEWPSEVFRIDLRTGKSERAFRRKDRAVTDVLQIPGGPAYLAAIEPAGTLRSSPVPGKLRILTLAGGGDWTEMPVDYRAFGHRAMLAASGAEVWAATDSGMILKLAEE